MVDSIPSDKNNLELMKPYILNLCKMYLDGIWKSIELQDFNIKKPSGGLSNHLYMCKITNNDFKPIKNEPTSVFVRIYGETHHKDLSYMVNDIVVTSKMGDYNIGPKLLGVFPLGRLEEMINASPLIPSDTFKPNECRKIAIEMAKFHSLQMPFKKDSRMLFDTAQEHMRKIKKLDLKNEVAQRKYDRLISLNLWKEFLDLWDVVKTLNSSVVFCHNDCNSGNFLNISDVKLMLIDYEFASYNFRGFDVGNFFNEMMFDYHADNLYSYDQNLYPTREIQEVFGRSYIKKFQELNEDQKDLLSLDQLLNEASNFALVSHLYWTIWCIMNVETSTINFDYMQYAIDRCDAYFIQKKIIYPNGFNK